MTPDDPLEAPNATDTPLVERVRAGDDPDAFGQLYDRWFDRVHDLAYRILYDYEAAADVAQEAFLSAWRNIGTLEDPNAFGGWLLRIARNGALNRKRKDERSRPVDEERLAVIEATQVRPEDRISGIDDPTRVAEDSEIAALLWSAADALGERDREVLDLHLRHELPPAAIAEVMDLNRNAANQLVHRVRQRLATAVGARVLWRGGTPECAELRAALAAAGVEAFDAEAVRVAEKHTGGCDACADRQRTRLSPAQMFSAVPFLAVPSLKAKVAHALAAEGVPMQGSTATAFVENGSAAGSDGGSGSIPRHRIRHFLVGAGVAAGVVVAATAIGASRLSDDQRITTPIVDNSTTTTAESTTTTALAGSTTTAAPVTTTTRGVPVVTPTSAAPPTTAPPPTVAPTTAPPAPVINFTITPASVPETPPYSMTGPDAPHAIWSVSGAHTATLTGPYDFIRSGPSGNVALCPVEKPPSSVCQPPPGTFTYTLDVFDAAGELIGSQSRTLTIRTP